MQIKQGGKIEKTEDEGRGHRGWFGKYLLFEQREMAEPWVNLQKPGTGTSEQPGGLELEGGGK